MIFKLIVLYNGEKPYPEKTQFIFQVLLWILKD